MITREKLNKIKDDTRKAIGLDGNQEGIRVLVGYATCGIAAGAKPVMTALEESLKKSGKADVTLEITGCIGLCQYEPIVEVFMPGREKVTYVNMDAEKAAKVVTDHIIGGKIVDEYTIGA